MLTQDPILRAYPKSITKSYISESCLIILTTHSNQLSFPRTKFQKISSNCIILSQNHIIILCKNPIRNLTCFLKVIYSKILHQNHKPKSYHRLQVSTHCKRVDTKSKCVHQCSRLYTYVHRCPYICPRVSKSVQNYYRVPKANTV